MSLQNYKWATSVGAPANRQSPPLRLLWHSHQLGAGHGQQRLGPLHPRGPFGPSVTWQVLLNLRSPRDAHPNQEPNHALPRGVSAGSLEKRELTFSLQHAYLATAKDLDLKATEEEAIEFGKSVGTWPAFPDSAESLARLNRMGLKQVILSNVNNDSFDLSRQKLEKDFKFDAVYTAEKIGSYKPQLRNFDYAIQHIKDEFGIGPEQILVVANSKLHDVLPGHKKGLKAAWISRTTTKPVMGVSNFSSVQPDWTFFKMADFADEMAKFNP
ncbi:uncharacterized protein EHS24_003967 [Apiotrichum porosum]|uniref:Haloacid dehalogenase, type II n=1 Tax=Apiotrichum porosum TaxID=105984 RepID=A0A427XDU9_9TREE|nr:uncharacterized protein EHS24_003967 [Apiotrichum porosum]RSH77026.1 hypothetical protein EHS24_003967 [Apiotrichum porosum]